jgi:hypothetical protein
MLAGPALGAPGAPETQKEQLTEYCPTLATAGGALNGFDVLRRISVSPHLEHIYLLLLFQNQPIYMMLAAYKPATEWTITAVNWHTDESKVLPPDLVPPNR